MLEEVLFNTCDKSKRVHFDAKSCRIHASNIYVDDLYCGCVFHIVVKV